MTVKTFQMFKSTVWC